MKNGLFNLWNLNFVKESFEKIYAKSKTLKKKKSNYSVYFADLNRIIFYLSQWFILFKSE